MNSFDMSEILFSQGWNVADGGEDRGAYMLVGTQNDIDLIAFFVQDGNQDKLISVNLHRGESFCLGATFEDWSSFDYSYSWADERLSPPLAVVEELECRDPYCGVCNPYMAYLDELEQQALEAENEPVHPYEKYDPELA